MPEPEPGAEAQAAEDGGQDSGGAATAASEGDADASEGAGVARPTAAGTMSKADAARVLDAVKDGTPRVAVGGRDAEKDW